MSKGNETVFPIECQIPKQGWSGIGESFIKVTQGGLTKREYFAGLAMQGLLANPNQDLVDLSHQVMSAVAMDAADALLAELAK